MGGGGAAATPAAALVGTSPSLAGMSCTQKIEEAIGMANIPGALLAELGGIKGIAAAVATAGLWFAVLQLTPVGWAADIAAALFVMGVVISGSEIVAGVKALYDCWHIACKEARTEDDLKRAGAAFADGVAKIGINGVLLVLDAKAAKRLGRANEVANAYREHGVPKTELPSYVAGTELGEAVTRPTLMPGDEFEIWVRDGAEPGIHAAPPSTDPETLGIELDGRHLETYRVTEPLTVTQSTVADFPQGKVPGVGGSGGGTQYILPPGWENSATKVGR